MDPFPLCLTREIRTGAMEWTCLVILDQTRGRQYFATHHPGHFNVNDSLLKNHLLALNQLQKLFSKILAQRVLLVMPRPGERSVR